jgi:5'-nucleotidase
MNILLTNDDGIDSPGILLLAGALRERSSHRIFILAPDRDRSGFSHSIRFLAGPLRLSQGAADNWSCSGSPADCVIMALLGFLPVRPDLVISGINRGANLGTDMLYSGTAAAARQASLGNIPAIALSLAGRGEFHWDMAVSWALDHLDELRGFWKPGTFVNVNIPNNPGGPAGMKTAFPAQRFYNDKLSVHQGQEGDSWCFVELGSVTTLPEEGSDWDAVSKNLAAVTPVLIQPAGDFGPDGPQRSVPEKGPAEGPA